MNIGGISIIIPTLNEEKYIGKILECLVLQSYKNFEVIIVDGGSTDNTCEIIKRFYSKLNISLLQNKGVLASARNKGGNSAKNELLLFMDADGTFDYDYLEESISLFNKKQLDFSSSKLIPSENNWYYRIFFSSMNLFGSMLQRYQPITHGCCTFIKKKLFLFIGGYDTSLTWLDDKEIGKRANDYGKFRLINTYIVNSVRRFEEGGTKSTMWKWGLAYYYYLRNNLKKTNDIQYDFG